MFWLGGQIAVNQIFDVPLSRRLANVLQGCIESTGRYCGKRGISMADGIKLAGRHGSFCLTIKISQGLEDFCAKVLLDVIKVCQHAVV